MPMIAAMLPIPVAIKNAMLYSNRMVVFSSYRIFLILVIADRTGYWIRFRSRPGTRSD